MNLSKIKSEGMPILKWARLFIYYEFICASRDIWRKKDEGK